MMAIDDGAEALALKGVSYSVSGNMILEDVNLTVRNKDFLGLIGPNGGGKTTLLRLILGMLEPDWGRISVFGQTPRAGRRYVGYLPQFSDIDLGYPISVIDVVLMSRMGMGSIFHRYSEDDLCIAKDALKKVGMINLMGRRLSQLSGGQKQRVFIARALARLPRLLILDEPLAGVDIHREAEFYELLREINREIPIILVSHDISAVSVYVNKVACLNRRLFYHDTKEISEHDLRHAYECPVEMIAHGVPHRVLANHK